MAKVVDLERSSLRTLIDEIQERGPGARGVIGIVCENDGRAHFRISGFAGKHDAFTVLGLLDWIKADILSDIAGD